MGDGWELYKVLKSYRTERRSSVEDYELAFKNIDENLILYLKLFLKYLPTRYEIVSFFNYHI